MNLNVTMDLNTALNYAILLLGTIATFAQGYFIRRRYALGILTSSAIMIFQVPAEMSINGIGKYSGALLSSSTSDVLTAVVFVAFLWILGYTVGGIVPKRDKIPDYSIYLNTNKIKKNEIII